MNPSFEWDEAKAQSNQHKHGVRYPEAATAFADPLAAIFSAPDHSDEKTREVLVGLSERGRLLVVSLPSGARTSGSSAPGWRRRANAGTTKRT
jgi:uncharacterized DUF497 family protein